MRGKRLTGKPSSHDTQRDLIHLLQIQHELQLALSFLDGVTIEQFAEDELRQHAVAMAVAQAGEHVKKLSRQFVASQPDIAWRAIAGTRDWVVHDYGNLDFDTIYQSVTEESPEVMACVKKAIAQIGIPDTHIGDIGSTALKNARGIN